MRHGGDGSVVRLLVVGAVCVYWKWITAGVAAWLGAKWVRQAHAEFLATKAAVRRKELRSSRALMSKTARYCGATSVASTGTTLRLQGYWLSSRPRALRVVRPGARHYSSSDLG